MFELFGFWPILKILGIVFVVFFLSFLIGRFISNESTENKGIHLFIGLSSIISIIAIYSTFGLSVFTPSFITILILFKPKLKLSNFEWKKAFTNTIQLLCLFIVFLAFELYRQSYFSEVFFNSGFGDYQFYTDAAQNIWNEGVESSLAYLAHFNLPIATNIYHYYDLYMLVPIFIFKIPPLIGYLFYFLPLTYSIIVFSLVQMTKSDKNRLVVFVIAFFAIHIPGIEMPEMISFNRLTMVHYPKACFMIFPILLLSLRHKWSLNKTLISATFLSLMMNPLIFVLIGATSLSIFFIYRKKQNLKFASFFKLDFIVIYVLFIAYFILVFIISPNSDNSVLFTFMDNPTLTEFLTEVYKRFVGYSGVIKKLPVLAFTGIILFYRFYKTKKMELEVIFITVTFIIGHIANSFMYNHYEGMQFFNISIVALIAIYFLFSAQGLVLNPTKYNKVIVSALFFLLAVVYVLDSYTVFSNPRIDFKTSVAYNSNLKLALENKEEINVLFFKNFTEETYWVRTIPYLTYGLGYINLHQNVNSILPTEPNMFLENDKIKQNAINLISRGPFSVYCQEMNLQPSSFYDESFKTAIIGFIEKYSINVLIFEKEMKIPNWVNVLGPKIIVKPEEDFDEHFAYVL